MFYSYPCPVCGKVFYTFNQSREEAAQTMYSGLEKHIQDYQEENSGYDNLDHQGKEFEDQNTVYSNMSSSQVAPEGGYNLD